jgi:hypothetical protein
MRACPRPPPIHSLGRITFASPKTIRCSPSANCGRWSERVSPRWHVVLTSPQRLLAQKLHQRRRPQRLTRPLHQGDAHGLLEFEHNCRHCGRSHVRIRLGCFTRPPLPGATLFSANGLKGLGSGQHDTGAPDVLFRATAVRHDSFEPFTLSGGYFHGDPAHRTDSHVESAKGIHLRTRPSRSIH